MQNIQVRLYFVSVKYYCSVYNIVIRLIYSIIDRVPKRRLKYNRFLNSPQDFPPVFLCICALSININIFNYLLH
jgi:hypothetical protein